MKSPENIRLYDDKKLAFILFLGFIEFSIAAIFIQRANLNSNNVFFFNLSITGFTLFLFTFVLGAILLAFSIFAYRGKLRWWSERGSFQKHREFWVYLSFVLLLSGLILLLTPPTEFGVFAGYFYRTRPLAVILLIYPFQLLYRRDLPEKSKSLPLVSRTFLISLGILLIISSFVVVTRLGITPDISFWNVAGIPLTMLQLFSAILITTLITGFLAILPKFNLSISNTKIDVILCLCLFVFTALLWLSTAMNKHFFSLQPQPPFYQPYPYSDARVHDLGAISIVKGWGIDFGEYTDKPLYMVFLAILHLFSGYDYNLLTELHVIILALIAPAIYSFGKLFHTRFLGLLLALSIVIRQDNAIILSSKVASVNPRLLTTEVPTLLLVIILTLSVFIWLKRKSTSYFYPAWIGLIIGMASLIRMNPVAFLPAILLFSFVVLWRYKAKWFRHSATILLGFTMMILPWVLTGVDATGRPYFFIKFYDVIQQRYNPKPPKAEFLPQETIFEQNRLISFPANEPYWSSSQIDPPDYTKFPFFVANHFFHNIIGAFLSLPDSFSINDQSLRTLVDRPYWDEADLSSWAGELNPLQLPFVLLNLLLIALGIGWSWNRWRLVGILPILIFLTYCLSQGLARSSGSRYLVPIDWILYMYYGIGVLSIFLLLPKFLKLKLQVVETDNGPSSDGEPPSRKRWPVLLVALMLLVALVVPIVDNMVPNTSILCDENQNDIQLDPALKENSPQGTNFLLGELLYPYFSNQKLEFVLLSCKSTRQFEINVDKIENLNVSRLPGQLVIIGWQSQTKESYEGEIILPVEDSSHP